MNKLTKLFTVLLLVCLSISMVACSSYGKVKKALTDIGYEVVEGEDADKQSEQYKDETVTNIHVFKKGNLTYTIVIEFKATEDLINYYKESSSLQGIVKDLEESEDVNKMFEALENAGIACDNCLIIPSLLDLVDTTNAIKNLNK